jgi:hypothetical protein
MPKQGVTTRRRASAGGKSLSCAPASRRWSWLVRALDKATVGFREAPKEEHVEVRDPARWWRTVCTLAVVGHGGSDDVCRRCVGVGDSGPRRVVRKMTEAGIQGDEPELPRKSARVSW